ncbi:replicative DNA helicase [Leptolyngbyaceae cyanobacterium CCMR0082]|uniref:Replicative DNA helicase n=2 Tax=Adonisia TaxID=2950183 RepID=A0A6M0SAQ3_9CYAN|nr:replicative DNA helicase [Adonisia turfae CCMR0082]
MLDEKHRLVRQRYQDLKDTIGFPLQVAWWGQESYTDGDVDELADLSIIRLISYEEFSNYVADSDEIPQKVLLEIEVAKYNSLEEDPFAQTIQEIKIGQEFPRVNGKRLDRLSKAAVRANGGVGQSIADVGCLLFTEIEERAAGAPIPGIKTGFYDLDEITGGGFQNSDLIVAAGRPAMGKTSMILNIATNMGMQGRRSAIVSLEMSKDQLTYRILASLARIESGRLRTGRIGQHEWESLGHATHKITELPIQLLDTNDFGDVIEPTPMDIMAAIEKMEEPPEIIFVDYLQLMGAESRTENEAVRYGQVSRGLKGIAGKLNIPIVALSQLSRGVESRTNKRPMMSDLRSSGAIEQDADLIMMLYRDEYYDPDTPDRGLAEVIIAKHRNGPTGTVKLLFEPQYTLFRNLANQPEYAA